MNTQDQKSFRILSIDGGGIRGIIPARILCELESHLSHEKGEQVRFCDYFDLICGTSTGGIIAIGLALGMSASEILALYDTNAQKIFGHWRWTTPKNVRRVSHPKHSNAGLMNVLKKAFGPYSNGNDETRLGHAKTRLAIPAYIASSGKTRVFKTSHNPELRRDYQVPAYQVALATSAAPTFFPAHTFKYFDTLTNTTNTLTNLVDGGIFANNPAIIGFSEAIALDVPIGNLKILSLGTGSEAFKEPFSTDRFYNLSPAWGAAYWMNPFNGPPLVEMMMQANSEIVDNTLKVLSRGVGNTDRQVFQYDRIQVKFDSSKERVSLDTTRQNKLNFLKEKGKDLYDQHGTRIAADYFKEKITHYIPSFSL
ncbi:CBASS cGAMP-activated phospholipase [Larkinella humicola]|uniref:CBASS cGAMP-activated phospholipase n=1 Tax=Larkinella humicola TaxID=2607654 RepID=UPI001780761B|nr:CBASS cGAMP-activated phospholipase [Larkinella humicola]